MSNGIQLSGCTPEPIAAYLKALGVLRVLAEQVDLSIRGFWRENVFHLEGITQERLIEFFCKDWQPTPVVQPWNNGTGFTREGKKNLTIPQALRFKGIRTLIQVCEQVAVTTGLNQQDKVKQLKKQVLRELRLRVPSHLRRGIEAAWIVTQDAEKLNFLLANGGMSGNADLGDLQSTALKLLFNFDVGQPLTASEDCFKASVFRESLKNTRIAKSIVFLDPGTTGSINGTIGESIEAQSNPWDYLLALEGLLSILPTVTRRYTQTNDLQIACLPFAVRPSTAGQGTLTAAETCRGEVWFPLWAKPLRWRLVEHLFTEARLSLGNRPAVTGLDARRAIASLGCNRSINQFVRYGYFVRNGDAQFAIPLGRFNPEQRPEAVITAEVDSWLEQIGRVKRLPNSIESALNRVRLALWDHASGGSLLDVVIALGQLEEARDRSSIRTRLRPLSSDWIRAANDGSIEFRLALAEVAKKTPTHAFCGLDDVAAFLHHETDDDRIDEIVKGLKLIQIPQVERSTPQLQRVIPASFALCEIAHSWDNQQILPLLESGNCLDATAIALVRLQQANIPVRLSSPIPESAETARRFASALRFSLHRSQIQHLITIVKRP